jgi:hypothetical protein
MISDLFAIADEISTLPSAYHQAGKASVFAPGKVSGQARKSMGSRLADESGKHPLYELAALLLVGFRPCQQERLANLGNTVTFVVCDSLYIFFQVGSHTKRQTRVFFHSKILAPDSQWAALET